MIVNLQVEGEHAFCGPHGKLERNGFSYNFFDFESQGILVKLAGWRDMSVPDSFNMLLDVVKSMHQLIEQTEQKVYVHCHAGYGRTGTVIASYLVFAKKVSAAEAIEIVRGKRPKSIQNKDQAKFVDQFEKS